jgi:hypothetical protein
MRTGGADRDAPANPCESALLGNALMNDLWLPHQGKDLARNAHFAATDLFSSEIAALVAVWPQS